MSVLVINFLTGNANDNSKQRCNQVVECLFRLFPRHCDIGSFMNPFKFKIHGSLVTPWSQWCGDAALPIQEACDNKLPYNAFVMLTDRDVESCEVLEAELDDYWNSTGINASVHVLDVSDDKKIVVPPDMTCSVWNDIESFIQHMTNLPGGGGVGDSQDA